MPNRAQLINMFIANLVWIDQVGFHKRCVGYRHFFHNILWVQRTPKGIFPLKSQIRYFSDHYTLIYVIKLNTILYKVLSEFHTSIQPLKVQECNNVVQRFIVVSHRMQLSHSFATLSTSLTPAPAKPIFLPWRDIWVTNHRNGCNKIVFTA